MQNNSNNLEVNTTVVPFALTYMLMHEFHNCRGHQGCTRTVLVERYEKRCKKHINSCITCSKNLLNTSHHPNYI